MSLAEKHVVVHAVSEIDQELFAVRASEARWMIEETQFTGWHREAAVFQRRFAHAALLEDKSLNIRNFAIDVCYSELISPIEVTLVNDSSKSLYYIKH